MWEKNKETTQCDKRTAICDKNRADVMLVLLNMTMEQSNLRKKKIIGTITFDNGTAQCEDGSIKCEKKVNHQMWKKNRHMWC